MTGEVITRSQPMALPSSRRAVSGSIGSVAGEQRRFGADAGGGEHRNGDLHGGADRVDALAGGAGLGGAGEQQVAEDVGAQLAHRAGVARGSARRLAPVRVVGLAVGVPSLVAAIVVPASASGRWGGGDHGVRVVGEAVVDAVDQDGGAGHHQLGHRRRRGR